MLALITSDTQGPAPVTQPEHYPGVNGVVRYDEGLAVGYRWYDETGQRPLFPFGYGLSYESFAVSGVHASYNPGSGVATVAARVTNTSSQSGPATLELYLSSPPAAQEPPKQLKGYATVNLAPGQSGSSCSAWVPATSPTGTRTTASSPSPRAVTPCGSAPPRPNSTTPPASR